jgi:hypothetical protein
MRTFASSPVLARCANVLVCGVLAAGGIFGSVALGDERARAILFVDDHDVLYRSGTKRVLHPLKRHEANPLIRGGERPWEVAIAWMSVYRNPVSGQYQLWYQAFAGDRARDKTRRCVISYAESNDGIHFTKPNLGLFDFNGIKETSIVLVANGGTSDRYGVSVVVDPRDSDPNRRYKMAYFDFTRDGDREYPGLSVAFSPDGVHWTKHPHGPLSRASYGDYGETVPFVDETNRPWAVPLSMADALDAVYDPPRQVFAIYGKMWTDGPDGGMYWKHAMGRIESRDFVHWSKPELLLTPDDQDPAWLEFHTTPVFFYADCYFSPLQILDRGTQGGVVDIELATSRDGLRWERPFRKPFWLQRTGGPAFDSGSIFLCPQAVVLDDEIRFYYGAYSQGATGSDDYKLSSGIGVAVLPRDRFAGLQPVPRSDQPTLRKPLDHTGQITLKPINFAGVTDLHLNADARAGTVRAELLNSEGKRIPGFSKDEAVAITGDSFRHTVRWRSLQIADAPSKTCLLRLHLQNATVYALDLVKSKGSNRDR